MNLPESLLIQCKCGTIIRLDAKVVFEKEEVDEAVVQQQSAEDMKEAPARRRWCSPGPEFQSNAEKHDIVRHRRGPMVIEAQAFGRARTA